MNTDTQDQWIDAFLREFIRDQINRVDSMPPTRLDDQIDAAVKHLIAYDVSSKAAKDPDRVFLTMAGGLANRLAVKLMNDVEITLMEKAWLIHHLQNFAKSSVSNGTRAHRPARRPEIKLWVALDKLVNQRVENDLQKRWNFCEKARVKDMLRGYWLDKAQMLIQKFPDADWPSRIEQARSRLVQK